VHQLVQAMTHPPKVHQLVQAMTHPLKVHQLVQAMKTAQMPRASLLVTRNTEAIARSGKTRGNAHRHHRPKHWHASTLVVPACALVVLTSLPGGTRLSTTAAQTGSALPATAMRVLAAPLHAGRLGVSERAR